MTSYEPTVRALVQEDALKGHGYLARKQREQQVKSQKLPQSRAFLTYGRDQKMATKNETIIPQREMHSPTKIGFFSKKPVVHSLQKSLLKTDMFGYITKNQSPLRSRFGKQTKVDDSMYPAADLNGTIEQKLNASLSYQQQQQEFYMSRHLPDKKKHFHGSACFEAPYKGQKVDKTASRTFESMLQSYSAADEQYNSTTQLKDSQRLQMNMSVHESDYFIEPRDPVIRDNTKQYNFKKQIVRSVSMKTSKTGVDMKQDNYNFDYTKDDFINAKLKTAKVLTKMSRQPGRDGKIVPNDIEALNENIKLDKINGRNKWIKSSILDQKDGGIAFRLSCVSQFSDNKLQADEEYKQNQAVKRSASIIL